jgi:GTP-binding protein
MIQDISNGFVKLISKNAVKVAIVGRANVGKSSIFNKMIGKKLAIVKDIPGTTRDTKEHTFDFANILVTLVDTAGLENIPRGSLPNFVRSIADRSEARKEATMYEQMIEKSLNAIKTANLCIFVVDGKKELSEDDFHFAKIAKRFCKNTMLCINKCESEAQIKIDKIECLKLGFGDPYLISADHSIGFTSIYEKIQDFCNEYYIKNPEKKGCFDSDYNQDADDIHEDAISLAIVGRPNAGKSTLINKIIGYDKLVTGDKAGITRDSISTKISYKDHEIKIIDTAGVRKTLRQKGDELEKLSTDETFRAIRLANVVGVVVDVSDPFVTQDLHIAHKICEEGRGVFVIMNKWDKLTAEEKKNTKQALLETLDGIVSDVFSPIFVITSAINGFGVEDVLTQAIEVYNNWNKRIKTPLLNEWIREVSQIQRPKMVNGRATKLKYITQIKTRPPMFNLFVNQTEGIERSYLRFLSKRVSKDFGLRSIPIRIKITKNDPYPGKKIQK